METTVQALDIVPNKAWAEVLPPRVAASLPVGVQVFHVDDDASDTAAFSARYGFGLEDCANTIVVRYRKEGAEHRVAIVTLGSRRLDVNGALKAHLGAQRLSFEKREAAVDLTGMEFGGITAFGAPDDWLVLVDEAVMARRQVVMGAGIRAAKLLLEPGLLTQLPRVQVAALAVEVEVETNPG